MSNIENNLYFRQDCAAAWNLNPIIGKISFHKDVFPGTIFQITYIEGRQPEDKLVTQYIAENLDEIKELFQHKGYEFNFLPEKRQAMKDSAFQALPYLYPYASETQLSKLKDDIENRDFDMYKHGHMRSEEIEYRSAFLVYLSHMPEFRDRDDYVYSYCELSRVPEGATMELLIKCFSLIIPDRGVVQDAMRIRQSKDFYEMLSADDHFDSQSQELIDEVREKIELLRQNGVSEMLLNSLLMPTRTLSDIHITTDYRIVLPDYNDLEIKMTPLVKSVYILFLRHEEGILFKDLADYRDELFSIYSKVTNMSDLESIKDSIDAICDPLDNSINEKCARIRETFIKSFDQRLAEYYYITGLRGTPKQIKLPRENVHFL